MNRLPAHAGHDPAHELVAPVLDLMASPAKRLRAQVAAVESLVNGPVGTRDEIGRRAEQGSWFRGARHMRVAIRAALAARRHAVSPSVDPATEARVHTAACMRAYACDSCPVDPATEAGA